MSFGFITCLLIFFFFFFLLFRENICPNRIYDFLLSYRMCFLVFVCPFFFLFVLTYIGGSSCQSRSSRRTDIKSKKRKKTKEKKTIFFISGLHFLACYHFFFIHPFDNRKKNPYKEVKKCQEMDSALLCRFYEHIKAYIHARNLYEDIN